MCKGKIVTPNLGFLMCVSFDVCLQYATARGSSPPPLSPLCSPRHFLVAFADGVRVAFRSTREFDFFKVVVFFLTRVARVFRLVALGDARFRECNKTVPSEFSDDDPFGIVSLDVSWDVARVVVMV